MAKTFKGTTAGGFEYKIEASRFDDMEFMEMLAESSDDDPLALTKIMTKLLGKKQKKRLYEHLRNEDGIVPVTGVVAELNDIFSQIKAIKK